MSIWAESGPWQRPCARTLPTSMKTSSKVGLRSGSSLQHVLMIWMHSSGASSMDTAGRHSGGGDRTFSIISAEHGMRNTAHLLGLSQSSPFN